MAHKKPSGPVRGWHTGRETRRLLGKGRGPIENAALELNTSSTTIYRWCMRNDWPDHLVDRMAEYLGVNPEWLRTGKGEKFAGNVLPDGSIDRNLQLLLERYLYDIQRVTKRYTREIVLAIKNPEQYNTAPNTALTESRD